MPFLTTAEQPLSAVETGHSKCRLWVERLRTRVAAFGRLLPVEMATVDPLRPFAGTTITRGLLGGRGRMVRCGFFRYRQKPEQAACQPWSE